jgi:predicted O-linked N-acetylglucosamine transferase (SPINDLY family)
MNELELSAIREKVARNRDTCSLFDTAKTARSIEAAFSVMYERSSRGLPPAGFSVD